MVLVEACYLQVQVIIRTYLFDVPAVSALGSNASPVHFPKLFVVLASFLCCPSLLWDLEHLYEALADENDGRSLQNHGCHSSSNWVVVCQVKFSANIPFFSW